MKKTSLLLPILLFSLSILTACGPPLAIIAAGVVVSTQKKGENNSSTLPPPPVITNISITEGPLSGGADITITGKNFSGSPIRLTMGGKDLISLTVKSGTEITGIVPAHGAGTVDLVVTTPYGSYTLSQGFTYYPAPTLTSITPNLGVTAGGNSVTLLGTNFLDGKTSVKIGGIDLVNLKVENSTKITGTTGAHSAGPVDVEVSTPGGTATLTGGFIYDGAPPSFGGVIQAEATSPTSIELSWSQATDNLSDSAKIRYLIYYSTTSGGQNFSTPQEITFAGHGKWNVPLLAPSTTYYFVVRAQDEAGNIGSNTTEISFTTPAFVSFRWTNTGNMNQFREFHTATLLPNGKVLLAGGQDNGTALDSCELFNPADGTYTVTDSMITARHSHTATLLPNGKVLITGGKNGLVSLKTCEIYDPVTETFSSAGSLTTGRHSHTATLLSDGRVLLIGGNNGGAAVKTCEIYDPKTGIFSLAGSLNTERYSHTATLLPNQKVLVVGGRKDSSTLKSCELYDPSNGTFTLTGSLSTAREQHTATLLTTGKVLVTGGKNDTSSFLNSSELYDSEQGSFSPGADMNFARFSHRAVLLPNGKVLICGGFNATATNTNEIYNTLQNTFSLTANFSARGSHGAVLLATGEVLVTGGSNGIGSLKGTELFTPFDLDYKAGPDMSLPREQHTATLLPNGKVLLAGGIVNGGLAYSHGQVYDPVTNSFSSLINMNQPRYLHRALLLPNGKVLILGGRDTNTAELFDYQTNTFLPAASMIGRHIGHTATLLSNGQVLITGGNITNQPPVDTAELYDPVTGQFHLLANRMTTPRSWHHAVLLHDGRVFIIGGTASPSAEVYNPLTGLFTPLSTPPFNPQTVTLLPGGQVLIVKGKNSYLYNPTQDTYTALPLKAYSHLLAVLLPNGKVLFTGGNTATTAEVFDPISKTFTQVGTSLAVRQKASLTLLPNGKVFLAGGRVGFSISTKGTLLYSLRYGSSTGWKPVINKIDGHSTFPVTLFFGDSPIAGGTGFTGISNGSEGVFFASPANYPVPSAFQLGRSYFLPVIGGDFSSSSFKFFLPSSSNKPASYYLFFVVVNGIPSEGKIIKLE